MSDLNETYSGAIKLIPIPELEKIECEVFQNGKLSYFGAILTKKEKILGGING